MPSHPPTTPPALPQENLAMKFANRLQIENEHTAVLPFINVGKGVRIAPESRECAAEFDPADNMLAFFKKYYTARDPDGWAVLTGPGGYVVIDCETDKSFKIASEIFPETLHTFGSKGGHVHLRIKGELPPRTTHKDGDGNLIFEVLVNWQVPLPGSIHRKTGEKYKLLHDAPVQTITSEEFGVAIKKIKQLLDGPSPVDDSSDVSGIPIEASKIPSEIFSQIASEVEKTCLESEGEFSKVRIDVDYPMTWREVKALSTYFTNAFHRPILVFPKISSKISKDDERIKPTPLPGYFCEFDAQLIIVKTISDRNTLYEVAQTYYKQIKNEHCFFLAFSGEKPPKAALRYLPDESFSFTRHAYVARAGEYDVQIFTETPLELGNEYRLRGLVWSATDGKTLLPSHEYFMLVSDFKPTRELMQIDANFFDRFRKLSDSQFVNACAYPFENSVSDYKELIFLVVFYIKSSLIPLNILLLGAGNCTKSGFLTKLAAIARDPVVDSGSSTLKGLLPSFAAGNPKPGVLATSRYFALVNEFFEIIKSGTGKFGPESFTTLSRMKNMLEGVTVPSWSGNGNMETKMRGSVFMASNWISIQGGVRLTTVREFYNEIDPPFLDRLLIYPVPHELQNDLVAQHKGRVDRLRDMMKEAQNITGESEILRRLENPYGLTCEDLNTILRFKEQLNVLMDDDSLDMLAHYSTEIAARYSVDFYSRNQDFIKNIASAYAFREALQQGEVAPDTKRITIRPRHVRDAGDFYCYILERHFSKPYLSSKRREEIYSNSLTEPQKHLYNFLWNQAKRAISESVEAYVNADAAVKNFKTAFPEADFSIAAKFLLDNQLVGFDGQNFIFIDYLLENGVIDAITMGGRDDALTLYEEVLNRNGLLSIDAAGKMSCPWRLRSPFKPSEEIQKQVIDVLTEALMNPLPSEDIRSRLKLKRNEDAQNALDWLVMSGYICKTAAGYLIGAVKYKG